jgi:hypothetical protein
MRQAPKQECPRCRHPDQTFRPRHERTGDNTIVVFIQCTACGWRNDLRTSTKEIERLLKEEQIVQRREASEIARHGVASNATNRILGKIRAEIRERRARDIPQP